MIDLYELERLEREATPAPWECTKDYEIIYKDDNNYLWRISKNETSLELIIALRNAVPELIAEVKRLREALEKYANDDYWDTVSGWIIWDCLVEGSHTGIARRALATQP